LGFTKLSQIFSLIALVLLSLEFLFPGALFLLLILFILLPVEVLQIEKNK